MPGAVRERAAGVPGVERGVGLDDVVDHPSALGRQRPAERRDDARRDRAGEAVRVADRDDELTDAEALGVAELRRHEVLGVGTKHREIRVDVGADDLEPELAAVDEGRPARAPAARDHVRRGEHESVGRDHDRAPAAVQRAAPAAAVRHAQVRDRGREALRHGDHRAGVRVEGFGLARRIGDERQSSHASKLATRL